MPKIVKDYSHDPIIIEEHLGWLHVTAARYRKQLPPGTVIDFDDLYQEGFIGLMDAIEKWSPDRKVKFRSYAEFRVKGAIVDMLRAWDWVPRSIREKDRALQAKDPLFPGTACKVISLQDLRPTTGSVLTRREDRGADTAWEDFMRDTTIVGPDEMLCREDLLRALREAMSDPRLLSQQHRSVLSLYYDEGLTMARVGDLMGVTESRVSQIRLQALKQLGKRLAPMRGELYA